MADHTSIARGATELTLDKYHIPLLIYAPKHVAPRRVDTVASQIDVAPTLLGLLKFHYHSKFFGHDVLAEGQDDPHVFLSNYQTVGFVDGDVLVELKPRRRVQLFHAHDGTPKAADAQSEEALHEAISFYQAAAQAFQNGALRQGAL